MLIHDCQITQAPPILPKNITPQQSCLLFARNSPRRSLFLPLLPTCRRLSNAFSGLAKYGRLAKMTITPAGAGIYTFGSDTGYRFFFVFLAGPDYQRCRGADTMRPQNSQTQGRNRRAAPRTGQAPQTQPGMPRGSLAKLRANHSAGKGALKSSNPPRKERRLTDGDMSTAIPPPVAQQPMRAGNRPTRRTSKRQTMTARATICLQAAARTISACRVKKNL